MSRSVSFVLIVLALSSLSFACGFNKDKQAPVWKFPSDKAQILKSFRSVEEFNGEKIDVLVADYKGRGFLVKAPDENWWLFKRLAKFSKGGKVFAIQGLANFPSVEKEKIKYMSGCDMNILLYDESGEGKFDHVVASAYRLDHIPAWVTSAKK